MRRPALILALAAFVGAAPVAAQDGSASWATSRAADLVRQGRDAVQRGDGDVAAKRFVEAIALDGSFPGAYLELGALRERAGDRVEAERTYDLGIERVPGFARARLARSRLRALRGAEAEALADLEAAAADAREDVAVLTALAEAYVRARALPAALAVTRRLEGLARRTGDEAGARRLRAQAVALVLLVGEADPVAAGEIGRGAARALLARATRLAPRAGPAKAR